MIAIAESGSTKCEWAVLDSDGELVKNFRTQGFNPDFHNSDFVARTLMNSLDVVSINDDIEKVYFYGASCSSPLLNKAISSGLAAVFPNAEISVDHDLVAAAYSLYEGEPLIACILGTGSNSGFFDGNGISEALPAMGFIMGDEAGGAYFGKRLVADYFYNRLPSPIQEDFANNYGLTWDETRKKIYGDIHANVFLASFMPFIVKYKSEAYVQDMIRQGISRFIDIHVRCFEQYKEFKVGFVGTIAFIFQDIIREELTKSGFKSGKFIKSPVMELVNYHKEYLDLLPKKFIEKNPIH